VLEPDIPMRLLNEELGDDDAFAKSHIVKGQLFSNIIPGKVVRSGFSTSI